MINKKSIIYALSIFVGTIIGVGLFGMPYVGAKSGFFILAMYLIGIGALVIVINSFYGEIASKTKQLHRLPGYAEIYLGQSGKRVAFIVKILSLFGALLAYLIVGGQFLANLFGGSVILYTFIFFIIGAFLIWQDQRSVGPVELIMLFIFLIMIIFLFFIGLKHIESSNLLTFNSYNFFTPYGVILFSLWGASIIPEVKEIVKGNFKKIRKTIIIGIILCIAIYMIFNLLVIGISGTDTTEDAISGLKGNLGDWVLKLGYFFGIITTFTSFIALGLTVKKIFWYDYHLPKSLGWALACFIPLILFIAGLQDFIHVISLTGAIMLGLDGILITLIYLRLKKKEKFKRYPALMYFSSVLIFLLSVGVVLEVFYFFKGF